MDNGRDVRSGKLRSWTPCVQPRHAVEHTMCESSYILCKREGMGSNMNDLYAVAVICVGARVYMRARTCSLRKYAQIIIGENIIWRFCDRSPNRQIKALAKISRYTVYHFQLVRTCRRLHNFGKTEINSLVYISCIRQTYSFIVMSGVNPPPPLVEGIQNVLPNGIFTKDNSRKRRRTIRAVWQQFDSELLQLFRLPPFPLKV